MQIMKNHYKGFILIITLIFTVVIDLLLMSALNYNKLSRKIIHNYRQATTDLNNSARMLEILEAAYINGQCSMNISCDPIINPERYIYTAKIIYHDDCNINNLSQQQAADYIQLTLTPLDRDHNPLFNLQSIIAIPSSNQTPCHMPQTTVQWGRQSWYQEEVGSSV